MCLWEQGGLECIIDQQGGLEQETIIYGMLTKISILRTPMYVKGSSTLQPQYG